MEVGREEREGDRGREREGGREREEGWREGGRKANSQYNNP